MKIIMKYIKLLTLAVTASLFAACSSDDVEYNSADGVAVEFEQTAIQVRENERIFNVPIKVSGKRNGNIQLKITAAETGETPAKEGVNYVISDKTLTLNPDTLSSGVINVNISVLDDKEANNDRTFTITIAEANGAEIGTAKTATVTILNDDGFYKAMMGEWTMSGYDINGSRFSCDVTLSGPTDPNDFDYEKTLTATTTNLLGTGETLTFPFEYTFDVISRSGQIGWYVDDSVIGQTSDGHALTFMYLGADGYVYNNSSFKGTWSLGPNGEPADRITFSNDLYLVYQEGSSIHPVAAFMYITLTKKQ